MGEKILFSRTTLRSFNLTLIEVYDNFLPEEVFTPIKEYIFSGQMPWYYMPNSVHDDDKCPQFSHALYVDCEPISDVYNRIKPIFATLNPIGIHRVKFLSLIHI